MRVGGVLFLVDSVNEDERLALEDAVNVTNDAGVLLVSIAGNEGFNNDFTKVYPGAFGLPNQIVVAASDFNDRIWHSGFTPFDVRSGFGTKSVAIAAPGVSIMSTAAHGSCALCVNATDSERLVREKRWDFACSSIRFGSCGARQIEIS